MYLIVYGPFLTSFLIIIYTKINEKLHIFIFKINDAHYMIRNKNTKFIGNVIRIKFKDLKNSQ